MEGRGVILAVVLLLSNVFQAETGIVYNPGPSYDYIIVGAGAAGCVLANRLSADSSNKVLLVEAGNVDFGNVYVSSPGLFPSTWNPFSAWFFQYTPYQAATALANFQTQALGGKILGGGGSVNAMDFVRGSPLDFDQWAEASGDPSWSYDNVLPYFVRMEEFGDITTPRTDYRGNEGPVKVTFGKEREVVTDHIMDAFLDIGVPFNPDYNSGNILGASWVQAHVDNNNERSSTSTAYLRPALSRPNLDVVVNAQVTKVLFDGTTATGVQISKLEIFEVSANKEVVLSAGGVLTPKILMLSGVGPRDHLESLGIDVVADLPVGKNFQDHINFPMPVAVNISTRPGLFSPEGPLPAVTEQIEYFVEKKGVFSHPAVEMQVFSKVRDVEGEPADWTDLQMMMNPATFTAGSMIGLNFDVAVVEEMAPIRYHENGFFFVVQNSRPLSRGEIRLSSNSYLAPPVLEGANNLDNDDDVNVILAGVKLILNAIESTPLQQVGARYPDTQAPSFCSDSEFLSDDYWRCMIRAMPITISHMSCTCKMGRTDDPETVVDSQLRVLGLNNLRVADGSIMPYIVSGNTFAPIVMIGEKASDLILNDFPVMEA